MGNITKYNIEELERRIGYSFKDTKFTCYCVNPQFLCK